MFLLLRVSLSGIFSIIKSSWTYTDPRTAHYPMISTPVALVTILGMYLYFVHSWGPRFMEHRQPYELKNIMIIYNAAQVVACLYLVKLSAGMGWLGEYNYICQPLSMEVNEMTETGAKACFIYFILKVVDLLDTVFMILRKNFRQVTFLHVYHHTGMVFASWFGAKVHPGGHPTLLGVINCIVHCVMYSYYLICTVDVRYKKVWWKKYITLLQIVQFGINVIHNSLPLFQPDCNVETYVCLLLVPQNIFMFVLFSDFYVKTYSRKSTKNTEA